MFQSIGFLGTGQMGGALARAAVKGAQGARVLLANRTPAKAQALADQLGCQATDNQTVAAQCQLIFLGVKPQMMEGLLKSIAPVLAGRKDRFVLASMAAGLTARRIQELAGADYPVIRLMPNTPAEVGAGVIQFCGVDVEPGELKDFQTLLAPAGLVDQVDEGLIDAVWRMSLAVPSMVWAA